MSGFGNSFGGSFGLPDDAVTTDEFIKTLRQIQPAILVSDDSDGHDLVRVLLRQLNRITIRSEQIDDERFIVSASDGHLDRIGAQYGVRRKTGEGDEKLRTRVKAARTAALSRGTYEDVARVAADALDTKPTQINLLRPSDTGQTGLGKVQAPSEVINGTPLSQSEIESVLSDAIIAGHRIQVEQSDAFTFGDSNNGFGTEWGQTF